MLALNLAAFAADKKPNPLAGTYSGVVLEDRAILTLKADGTVTARPDKDEADLVLRGTWKAEGKRLICKLKDPEGGEGTLLIRVDGRDLVLISVTEPSGDTEAFSPPLYALQKDGPKGKAPVGAYVGKHEGDEMRVELKANGRLTVKPTDPNAGADALMLGEWKRDPKAGTLTLAVDTDDGLARVTVKLDGAGLHLLRIEQPDGEVEEFTEARLKRVKAAPKKNAAAPPKAAAKKFVGTWKGVVKEDEISMQLKADGTAVVVKDEDDKLNGTWQLAGGELVIQVKVDDQVVTPHFAIDGADLILTKVVQPDGGEESHAPPRLRRTEALGNQKFAGIYEGEVDESDVKLTLEANGKLTAEVVACGELETIIGKWKAEDNRVLVSTADGVKATFRAAGKDLLLIRFESPDGEVKTHEPRFKKQKNE